jgi:hypothetical protein
MMSRTFWLLPRPDVRRVVLRLERDVDVERVAEAVRRVRVFEVARVFRRVVDPLLPDVTS